MDADRDAVGRRVDRPASFISADHHEVRLRSMTEICIAILDISTLEVKHIH